MPPLFLSIDRDKLQRKKSTVENSSSRQPDVSFCSLLYEFIVAFVNSAHLAHNVPGRKSEDYVQQLRLLNAPFRVRFTYTSYPYTSEIYRYYIHASVCLFNSANNLNPIIFFLPYIRIITNVAFCFTCTIILHNAHLHTLAPFSNICMYIVYTQLVKAGEHFTIYCAHVWPRPVAQWVKNISIANFLDWVVYQGRLSLYKYSHTDASRIVGTLRVWCECV